MQIIQIINPSILSVYNIHSLKYSQEVFFFNRGLQLLFLTRVWVSTQWEDPFNNLKASKPSLVSSQLPASSENLQSWERINMDPIMYQMPHYK